MPKTPMIPTRALRGAAPIAALLPIALIACGDDRGSDDADSPRETTEVSGAVQVEPGVHVAEDEATLRTEEFTVEPGEETYLCYAASVPEDLVIDGFSVEGAAFLHHLLLSRATAEEPEGLSECDVLFRYTWQPFFGAGAGDSELRFPDGTGHRIDAGQQLVLQMHLLNSTEAPLTGSAEIVLHRSTAAEPETIGTKTFGTFELSLPPAQTSQVEATCTIEEPIELLAVLPHMHQLGTALTFEVGDSEDSMAMVYERDPYDFDEQYVDPFELTLQPGELTRLRCSYFNPHDEEVGFGESSLDEMCFMMGFTRGEHAIGGCTLGESGGDFAPTACAGIEPAESGVGAPCTADGMECADGLRCTAGLSGDGDEGICIGLGCESSEECGEGVSCCTPELGGGVINICMPEACRPTSCAPID